MATAQEIKHTDQDRALFNGIARKYGKKDLAPSSATARRQRLLKTLAAVPIPDGATTLEVGCGADFSAKYLEGMYGRYVGVDYSEKLIQYADMHNRWATASFVVSDIKTFEPEQLCDVVLMIGAIYHLDEMPDLMRRIVRLVKPGGWVMAKEPQSANPLIRLASVIRKRVDPGYPDDQAQLSADELADLYRGSGPVHVRTAAQGLFSTPFAEVIMPAPMASPPLSAATRSADTIVESCVSPMLRHL